MSGTTGARAANLDTLFTFKWFTSYFGFVLNNLFNNFIYSNNFVKIASNIKLTVNTVVVNISVQLCK